MSGPRVHRVRDDILAGVVIGFAVALVVGAFLLFSVLLGHLIVWLWGVL